MEKQFKRNTVLELAHLPLGEEIDGLIAVESSNWEHDGPKWEYRWIVFFEKDTQTYWRCHQNRSGSPYTDWHDPDEHEEFMRCFAVEKVEKVIETWEPVKE